MSNYHHIVVNRRPLHSAPADAKPVAEVVVEADDPHRTTAFILDALDALGIPRADSRTLTEFSNFTRTDNLPPGKMADKPDWSNESVKVWLLRPV